MALARDDCSGWVNEESDGRESGSLLWERQRIWRFSLIIIVIGLFAAVRAHADDVARTAPPTPSQALIYIYRAPSFAEAANPALFDVDKIRVAKLENKQYTWFYVPASAHVMKQSWGRFALANPALLLKRNDGHVYDWQGGNTYYYRLDTSVSMGYSISQIYWGITSVDEAQALRELAVYKYVAPRDVDKIVPNPALLPATGPVTDRGD